MNERIMERLSSLGQDVVEASQEFRGDLTLTLKTANHRQCLHAVAR